MEPMATAKLMDYPYSHNNENSTAGLSGQHALGMLGRTLLGDIGWEEPQKFDKLVTPEIIFNQCSKY